MAERARQAAAKRTTRRRTTPAAAAADGAEQDGVLAVLVERALGAPEAERAAAVAAARQAVLRQLAEVQRGTRPRSPLDEDELRALLVGLSAIGAEGRAGGAVPTALTGGLTAVTGVVAPPSPPDAGTVLTPPAPVVTLLKQPPKRLSLSMAWTLEQGSVPCTGIRIELFEGAAPPRDGTPLHAQELGPDARTAVLPPADKPDAFVLVAGRTYCATATAHYATLGGTVTVDRTSAPLAVTMVDPDATTPLPRVAPEPRAFTSASPEAQRAAAQALAIAGRWRSKRLFDQAVTVVEQANSLEAHITQLQALQAVKVLAGEQVLQPVLQGALEEILGVAAQVDNLPVPDVEAAVKQITDAAFEVSILARFVVWLARTDMLELWKDLLWALIRDIAAFDTDLERTKEVIDESLAEGDLVAGIKAELEHLRGKILAEHDAVEDRVEAQLAEAIQVISAGVVKAVNALGVPLLSPDGATGDIPNPFKEALDKLTEEVTGILAEIRQKLVDGLDDLSDLGTDRLRLIVVLYVVLPVLAFLAVGLAGGPFGAAVLAAIVCIALQALVGLILRWLSGPIAEQLDALKRRVDEAVANLRALVEGTTSAIESALDNAAGLLKQQLELVAQGLKALRDLLPTEYLNEGAELLGAARDSLLSRATSIAHAAQLALGQECGAVFDVLDADYTRPRGAITQAPHLPGGTSAGRFAGERLLADLARLAEQQLRQDTGPEMLLTQRLSLFNLLQSSEQELGGPAPAGMLARLLSGQDVLVELTEQALLDPFAPGAHRALIERVRVTGVATGVVDPATVVPVQLTHLGPSRTRVRRDAVGALGPLSRRLGVLLGTEALTSAYRTAIAMGADGGVLTERQRAALWPAFLSWALRHQVRTTASALEGMETEELQRLLDGLAARLDGYGFPVTATLVPRTGAAGGAAHVPLGPDGMPFWLDDRPPQRDGITLVKQGVLDEKRPLPALDPRFGAVTTRIPDDAAIATWAGALARELQAELGSGTWGEARLEEDPNPDLRALGFAVLVRERPPQTLNLTLVPAGEAPGLGLAGGVANLLRAGGAGDSLATDAERYRPLENRGLGGQLLVRLPEAAGKGLYVLPDQVGTAAARLTDLVLEIDLRVCHDEGLAAALRSSSARGHQLDALVTAATGRTGGFLDERTLADTVPGRRLTLKYSLRSHRERVLSAWKSAVAVPGVDPDTLARHGVPSPEQVQALSFLGRDEPLTLLGGSGAFDLTFAVLEDPSQLPSRLTVTPAMLGLTDADLADPAAVLTGLAYVVVPLPGFEEEAGGVTASELLASLLPGTPRLGGLNIAEAADESQHVSLLQLFSAGGLAPPRPVLRFDLAQLLDQGALYDVLVAFFVTVPAARVRPAVRAVR